MFNPNNIERIYIRKQTKRMIEKVILFMLIASVTATWDTGILSYYGSTIQKRH